MPYLAVASARHCHSPKFESELGVVSCDRMTAVRAVSPICLRHGEPEASVFMPLIRARGEDRMLTTTDIALVRASFARVAIQGAAADIFYDRLFAVAPKLRELFPADLRAQK